ncbi:MAG: 3-isopropylmalate dehydrogenase, partial [Clostridiales bacterium]|nr:3-isopropylmalate dehydrogenase [Clostridiales bacterium]
ADAIENAVKKTLASGARTGDIATDGEKALGTVAITDVVISKL